MSEHCPAATVAVQVAALSASVTTTLPVGVPTPGVAAATKYVTVTVWPGADGSGVSEMTAVMVEAGFTVCVAAALGALGRKLASPRYMACRWCVPADGMLIEQAPAAIVPTHTAEPLSSSVTRTEPVGVPEPGASAVTVKPTVTC